MAETLTVEESGSRGSSWIVTEGLSDGDMLIVDGLSRLRSGQEIAPEEVTLDDDGVTMAAEGN